MKELISILLEQIVSNIIIDNSDNKRFWEYISKIKKSKNLHEFASLYLNKDTDFCDDLIDQVYLALVKHLKNVNPSLADCILNNKIAGILKDLKTQTSSILIYLSDYFLIQFNLHIINKRKTKRHIIVSGKQCEESKKNIDLYLDIPKKKLLQSKPPNISIIPKRKQEEYDDDVLEHTIQHVLGALEHTLEHNTPPKKTCYKPPENTSTINNNIDEQKLTGGDLSLATFHYPDPRKNSLKNDGGEQKLISDIDLPLPNFYYIDKHNTSIDDSEEPINEIDKFSMLKETDSFHANGSVTPFTPQSPVLSAQTASHTFNMSDNLKELNIQKAPYMLNMSDNLKELNNVALYDSFSTHEKMLLSATLKTINQSIDSSINFLQKLETNINANTSGCNLCLLHCERQITSSLKSRRGRPYSSKNCIN